MTLLGKKNPEAVLFNRKALEITVHLLITSIYNSGGAYPSVYHVLKVSAMVKVVTNEQAQLQLLSLLTCVHIAQQSYWADNRS